MRLPRPETTPALERLRLDGLPCDRFPDDGQNTPAILTFPSELFSQKLTSLSLDSFHDISLQPDSIILPLDELRNLIEAIVAPKLVSFCFESHEPFTIFDGLEPRFSGVQDIVLGNYRGYRQRPEDAEAVCLTFSNVRNVEMAIGYISIFFEAHENYSPPADLWDQLHCLVLDASEFLEVAFNDELESWIERRSAEGQPKLYIVFEFPSRKL